MTDLKFRNVGGSPEDPVTGWPFEGILAAIERGTIPDWRRLAAAIEAEPWGPVADAVTEAVRLSSPYGTTELMLELIAQARRSAADAERGDVATEVRSLLACSGLNQAEFARRIGTSSSRLSTYISAKVVPSAALLVRMRRVAGRASSP